MRDRIIHGDALAELIKMPAESVHCVVTSPPYWGLRDYGEEAQLGLEATPEEYVARMVEVFREVRRVLRSDGTLWLNMGDSYVGGGRAGYQGVAYGGLEANRKKTADRIYGPPTGAIPGLKPKDLCGMPWRLAFALQADGWWLRSDIIWHKPNPMPESVTDRPTKAHEYLFLLSKSVRYFYDAEAIREEASTTRPELLEFGERPDVGHPGHLNDRRRAKKPDGWDTGSGAHGSIHRNGREAGEASEIRSGRNKRTVWTIATQAMPEAHFATFPEKIVEPCIRAGTSERGVCPECGAPWVRVVEREHPGDHGKIAPTYEDQGVLNRTTHPGSHHAAKSTTTGWRPSCEHGGEPIPATVLEPFCGAATTPLVAKKLGRRFVAIELSAEYIEISHRRLSEVALWL